MQNVAILLVSMASGLITYLASNALKRGPVIASAIITLSAGLLLPHFFPGYGGTIAAAAACASYAGMISLENTLNIFEMGGISLMCGILFIAANDAYIGIGGRLGTIAAISCFAWLGFKKIFVGFDTRRKT